MTDQETEVAIEGDDQGQDQGQGVLTGIAETLAVEEIDSEGETGQTHIHHTLCQLLFKIDTSVKLICQ